MTFLLDMDCLGLGALAFAEADIGIGSLLFCWGCVMLESCSSAREIRDRSKLFGVRPGELEGLETAVALMVLSFFVVFENRIRLKQNLIVNVQSKPYYTDVE